MPIASGPIILSRSSDALTILIERGSSSTNSLNVGPREAAAHTGNFLQLGARESRFGQILLGQFAQAVLAEKRHVNRCGQREERLVRADIRRGLLAADVLLARRESKNEAAASFCIEGLTREPARELPNKFIARGDHAHVRPAITRRHAKTLTFHGDDVGFGRRLHNSERNCFRDSVHQKSAAGMGHFGERRNFFEHSEEIWRLNDDRGDVCE